MSFPSNLQFNPSCPMKYPGSIPLLGLSRGDELYSWGHIPEFCVIRTRKNAVNKGLLGSCPPVITPQWDDVTLSHCPYESPGLRGQGSGLCPIFIQTEISLFHIHCFLIIFCRTSDACELVAAWLTALCAARPPLPRLFWCRGVVVARGRAALLQRDLAQPHFLLN